MRVTTVAGGAVGASFGGTTQGDGSDREVGAVAGTVPESSRRMGLADAVGTGDAEHLDVLSPRADRGPTQPI